jgi:signal transduction histidine kinase
MSVSGQGEADAATRGDRGAGDMPGSRASAPGTGPQSDSPRVAAARAAAAQRRRRQHALFRMLAWVLAVLVIFQAFQASPVPGWHGTRLAVTAGLACYVVALVSLLARSREASFGYRAVAAAVMAAAGVALDILQAHGSGELATSAAVWVAMVRLPLVLAAAIAVPATVALAAASAGAGSSGQSVGATILLCVLLAASGRFMLRAENSNDRAELLLAQLGDAREAEAAAAAVAERGRIARDLHDVLAHSLSGLAIQLQAARRLAQKQQAGAELTGVLVRSAELATEGLADARKAVSALREDQLPDISLLPALAERYRRTMQLNVTVTIEGPDRPLTAERSATLYRAAQEALTNAARYAPGAVTAVLLIRHADRTTLRIENRPAPVAGGTGSDEPAGRAAGLAWDQAAEVTGAQVPVLAGSGGGHGLAGMRERVQAAGGSMRAGRTAHGWLVEVEVPG